ncbi:MAG: LysR family transcriptional regulator [Micrococcales bacterium]|nr:LysR family transcriptional regulator [Micrococcales bacterium]
MTQDVLPAEPGTSSGRRSDLEADAVHAFGVFAAHLSFTAAAATLHITQPSLHVKIRKLGAALGVELYRRQGRGLVLTEAGRQLAAYAHDAHRRADDLLATLRGTSGTVGVAAGRGACRWVVADGLRALAASGRNLTVTTARREAALTALHDGRVDIAVIGYEPPPGTLHSRRLAAYAQVHVVPSDHPHATRPGVTVADLSGAALVVPPAERPHRRALDRALADTGVPWRVAAEVDGWDLQVHLAGLGVGTTVVNGCVPPPPGWVAVPVTDLPTVTYWSVWRPGRDALLAESLALLHTQLSETVGTVPNVLPGHTATRTVGTVPTVLPTVLRTPGREAD